MPQPLLPNPLKASLMLAIWLWGPPADSARAAPDPRFDPSGYASWCGQQGGSVYNDARGYGCDVAGGLAEMAGGGANPFSMLLAPLGQAAGQGMDCLLNPNCPANQAKEAQREAERQEALRQQKIREEQWRQEEERRRQEFEAAKERMLGQLRGGGAEGSAAHGAAGEPALAPVRDLFGTTVIKPAGTLSSDIKPRELRLPRSMGSLDRARCSAWLLAKADQAIAQDKIEEGVFLSREAENLASGASSSPSVACPAPPEGNVPAVEGVPVAESAAQAEKLKKQMAVYAKLYHNAAVTMGKHREVVSEIKETEEKLTESKTKKEEADRKKQELEAQEQTQPQSVPESAMAEALEALREAEAALAENEKTLAEEQTAKAGLEKELEETRGFMDQMKKDPDQADQILSRLKSGEAPGTPGQVQP